MPPWPFFSTARSGSPRATTTPEDIDDGLHNLPGERLAFRRDSDVDLDLDDLQLPAPPFAASNSPRSKTGHTRSLSGNLPSIFGGRKRTTSQPSTPGTDPPTLSSQDHDAAASPRPRTAKPSFGEEVLETGSCATCASKVKWPAGVNEFRCGTCLMINTLKPPQKRPPSPNIQGQTFMRAGTYPGNGPDRRGLPLSLDRTKTIIGRCIEDFLLERYTMMRPHNTTSATSPSIPNHISSVPTAKDRNRTLCLTADVTPALPILLKASALSSPVVSRELENTSSRAQNVTLDNLRNAQTRWIRNGPNGNPDTRGSSTRGRGGLPAQPSRRPPPPPMQSSPSIPRKPLPLSPGAASPTKHEAKHAPQVPGVRDEPNRSVKHIFKPLEDYIVKDFGTHDALNRSFSSIRPRVRPAARSEDNMRRREPPSDRKTTFAFDGYDSQIDAKTLLLGDVAENGLWWAGKEDREGDLDSPTSRWPSEVPTEQLVHPKSPHINWQAVEEWYRIVTTCGEDWRKQLTSPALDGMIDHEAILKHAQAIEHAFLEARIHVQKTLLKASESLLKRLGRPMTMLSDTRFLLILLENPLLHPTRSAVRSPWLLGEARSMEGAGVGDNEYDLEDTTQGRTEYTSSYWEQGQTFGIIKRSLGLMSNLPNEIHRSLQSWFTRYDENRFRSLVTMIQSFVTHRLNRQRSNKRKDKPNGGNLIPELSGTGTESSAQLHAALGLSSPSKTPKDLRNESAPYSDDWQIKAASRIMAILFAANKNFRGERTATRMEPSEPPVSISRHSIKHHGQLLSMSEFYNLKADLCDLVADFETWELSKSKFSLCQFPFFLSVGSKIRILEHDAQRQMSLKAREAFFNSILHNKDLRQYLHLRVRRDCLVEDSLTTLSQAVAQGDAEIKKGLRVHFVGEEGIDAGGLRKEWFLLLVREIFDPEHGMFVYDEESRLCYFNPNSFEASEQYFLVGALLGLAIHNLTILDIAFPPFLFKKLLTSGQASGQQNAYNRVPMRYTLDELSELRPSLARGLRQLLEFGGNVQETYCRDFVADVERYGSTELIPLCTNGTNRPVTNSNRQEFVELYVRFLLDTHVTRQFEPFKRGFFTVCGGNALSLFQPEEIELLIRGSDEPLDVPSLKAVAVYDNWRRGSRKVDNPAEDVDLVRWFWDFLEAAEPKSQRKVLSFITGSDRIPAMGATSLVIKIAFAGNDYQRFPIARTCFNLLLLYKYRTKKELVDRLWRAVTESEGFGLK